MTRKIALSFSCLKFFSTLVDPENPQLPTNALEKPEKKMSFVVSKMLQLVAGALVLVSERGISNV